MGLACVSIYLTRFLFDPVQRINRTDPVSHAATQRLLIAVTLSLLLHAIVLSVTPGRGSDSNVPDVAGHVVLPRKFTLSASLLTNQYAFDKDLVSSQRDDRFGATSSLDTPDPRYYAVEELDVLPVPRGPIRLRQSTSALGKVRLLARIDASGRIVSVSVLDSDRTERHNTAALQALRDTPFDAALRNGQPVRSEVMVELAVGSGD